MILFLGDTHGDLEFVARACEFASDHEVDWICQVGDFGFLWPGRDKIEELSVILKHYGQTIRFLDGNHDDHVRLRKPYPWPENIIYQPRGSVYEDADGTRFLFMGGAASIDKHMRTPGKSWWPEETITESEMALALSQENIDVLVTHDAPDYPPGFRPAGSPGFRQLSTQSMNDVRELIRHHNPKLHVHGHWHHFYKQGVTVGLDCNYGDFFNDTLLLWNKSDLGDVK